VTLGKDGVEQIHSFGDMSAFEQKMFDSMIGDLKNQIKKGEEFVKAKM
jgi:malate/lactate dehydrogenase